MYWKFLKWTFGIKPTFKNGKENGEYGEWLGRKYLKKKGFVVLYSNWRSLRDRRNEIDLICMDQEMLVFVEVRARSENSFTTGFESLNKRKRTALLGSFKAYLREMQDCPPSYRFDRQSHRTLSQAFHREHMIHRRRLALLPRSVFVV